MDPTFGARLRRQREARQVTLGSISTTTKIKVQILEALESDQYAAWPKGLFGRAYLRDYAMAIGLDPETVVNEFLALHPEYAYVAPLEEEAEAEAREAARYGAAHKLRRFVSSAFSGRPAQAPIAPSGRTIFQDPPRFEGALVTSEFIESSTTSELAEAEERAAPVFAELDAREPGELEPSPWPPAVEAPTRSTPNEISLAAVAEICTRLSRAVDRSEVTGLLRDAARLLDAVGVIVWQWDAGATVLRPSLTCGYSDVVVAHLPGVRRDDANAVATAFRSGERCVVDGVAGTEAVVVPSLGVGGCVGVLAVELRPGTRERESICAFASILAAQLAMLLPTPEPSSEA